MVVVSAGLLENWESFCSWRVKERNGVLDFFEDFSLAAGVLFCGC